jgi:hypothetical protein
VVKGKGRRGWRRAAGLVEEEETRMVAPTEIGICAVEDERPAGRFPGSAVNCGLWWAVGQVASSLFLFKAA